MKPHYSLLLRISHWLYRHKIACRAFLALFAVAVALLCLHDKLSLLLLLTLLYVVLFMVRRPRQWLVRHLGKQAIAVWLCGVVVYVVGYNYGGSLQNAPSLLLRSLVSATAMFAGQSGLIGVSEALKGSAQGEGNALYMALFSMVHFTAVIVSVAFVVKQIGMRLRSSLRLLGHNYKGFYVIWGMGDAELALARSIRHHLEEQKEKADYAIVFVRTPFETQKSPKFSLANLFDGLATFHDAMDKAEALGALVCCSHSDVLPAPTTNGPEGEGVLSQSGLSLLNAAMQTDHEGHAECHAFFLTPDEDANLRNAYRLFRSANAAGRHNLHVHYSTTQLTSGRIAESEQLMAPHSEGTGRLHRIDPSALSVLSLKRDELCQPVRFAHPNGFRAVATAPLEFLIVGFGRTGQQLFEFLYEFSALPAADGTSACPFVIHIADPDVERLKASYLADKPALRRNRHVHFLTAEESGAAFHEKVSTILPTVNAVAICTGDDNLNLRIADELYNVACRQCHNNLSDFAIWVRVHEHCNEAKMKQMAHYYNTANPEYPHAVRIFGTLSEIYSYANIVTDTLLRDAALFFHTYQLCENGGDESKVCTWTQRRNVEAAIAKSKAKDDFRTEKVIPLYVVNDILRKERQDVANSLHMLTKLALAGAEIADVKDFYSWGDAYGDLKLPPEEWERKLGNSKRLLSPLLNATPSMLKGKSIMGEDGERWENLARCEHLRWNAAHELMGYTAAPPGESDMVTRSHQCLVSWDELDRCEGDYKKYDRLVVATTFQIFKNRYGSQSTGK